MSLESSRSAEGAHEGSADGSQWADAESVSLHPDLWRAMVSEIDGVRWYMDLDNHSIQRFSPPDGSTSLAATPSSARFVPIPTITTERQLAHARQVLAERLPTGEVERLTSGAPWLRHFHESADPELRQMLSDARRAWVVTEVRAWIREHDVPEHRFVRSARPAPRDTRPPPPRARGLRAAIHRAVDRMTERELDALQIPARLLVDD